MASSQDGNLGLWSGYTPGDNGWTSQHNSNWDALDAMVQPTVKNNTLTTPPGSPATGDAYIVPSGATGAWASQTNRIAVWQGRTGVAAWQFYTPKNGWQVYNQADGGDYLYNGSAWVLQGSQKLNVPQDYISGLKMVWNSNTSISVGTGSAYIPALSRTCQVNAALTLSSLSLSASTWYHVYLYENAGTPTIECVTTAPVAYQGTASQKTGDNTRRYLGSVRTDASGNVLSFYHDPSNNDVLYMCDLNTNQVLSAGTATAASTVSLSAALPVTSRVAMMFTDNTSNSLAILNNSLTATTTTILFFLRSVDQAVVAKLPTDGSQAIRYYLTSAPTSGGLSLWVQGYCYER